MKEDGKVKKRYQFCLCTTLDCTHKTFIPGRGIVWHERGKETLFCECGQAIDEAQPHLIRMKMCEKCADDLVK